MNINLSPAEYAMICRVADHYGSKPAALAHDWIMREAAEQYTAIYLPAGEGERDLREGRDSSPSRPPPAATAGTST